MNRTTTKKDNKIRYNILAAFIYIIGIVLLIQLFNLQIVHGEEYREQSNTRLTRESTLEASRGNISDSTGKKLVTTQMGFSVDLYKSKIDTQMLNQTILNMIYIFEQNQDIYQDNLPITVEPFSFTMKEEESQKKWKKNNKLREDMTAEECFYALKDKYEIKNDDIQDTRKIMTIRYEITQNGYSNTKAVRIAKEVSRESILQLTEQGISFPGISVVTSPKVCYTSGNIASHILGTVGKITSKELEGKEEIYNQNDIIGKTGIEYVFEEYLKGINGIKQIDMAVDGTVTDEYISKEAVAGSDVVLTIDANLQRITQEALKANIEKIASGGFYDISAADAGSAVVMNVKTGEVLAMASYPDYEPQYFANGISQSKLDEYNQGNALYHRAISGKYAPGSTYKMVTAISALENNSVTLKETINDTGVYPKAHNPVCWYWTSYHRGHGRLNVSDAIKHSCNYFFYEVGSRMGIDVLSKYTTYFGLGQKTGIELPSENSGIIASRETAKKEDKDWYLGDTLSAAIGQSYNSYTPLQMAKYISMLANGGKPINVSIVKTIINPDGSEVPKEEIEKFSNEKLGLNQENMEALNIKQENLNAVLEGMRGVTSESGGTAYSTFRNFNIEVGGKTGSAQAGDGSNKVNAWFVGFAPFENPEIAVVVLVENGLHGGYTAEVARDIIAEYFGMNVQQIVEDMTAIPNVEIAR